MNKHFNIKNITFIIFCFILFMGLNNIVKAKEVCYYSDPVFVKRVTKAADGKTKKEIDKNSIYVQMTYNNGKSSFKFYDSKNKKTYDSIIDLDTTNNDVYAISSKSGNQLKDSDFAFGCPKQLNRMLWPDDNKFIYDVFKIGTTEYKNFYLLKIGDSIYSKFETDMKNSKCYDYKAEYGKGQDRRKEYCDIAMNEQLPETKSDFAKNNKVKSCSYVNADTYSGFYDTDIKADLVIKISSTYKEISATETTATNNPELGPSIKFTYADTNGECPSIIYRNVHENNDQGAFYISRTTFKEDDVIDEYALIHHLKIEDVEDIKPKEGCGLLGNTSKGLLKMVFNLVRFLVPTIIIVMSVIDFAGVVLSGEDDKMAKAKSKFIKRLLIGILILFLPLLLEFILKLAGILESGEDLVDAACLK